MTALRHQGHESDTNLSIGLRSAVLTHDAVTWEESGPGRTCQPPLDDLFPRSASLDVGGPLTSSPGTGEWAFGAASTLSTTRLTSCRLTHSIRTMGESSSPEVTVLASSAAVSAPGGPRSPPKAGRFDMGRRMLVCALNPPAWLSKNTPQYASIRRQTPTHGRRHEMLPLLRSENCSTRRPRRDRSAGLAISSWELVVWQSSWGGKVPADPLTTRDPFASAHHLRRSSREDSPPTHRGIPQLHANPGAIEHATRDSVSEEMGEVAAATVPETAPRQRGREPGKLLRNGGHFWRDYETALAGRPMSVSVATEDGSMFHVKHARVLRSVDLPQAVSARPPTGTVSSGREGGRALHIDSILTARVFDGPRFQRVPRRETTLPEFHG